MKAVQIYTDGSCSGNPGPGGWAAILVSGKHQKEVVGGTAESTNNRAEIMAVIVSLEALKFACDVTVFTDSQYVIGVLALGWKRKANHDLLVQADALLAKHEVRFVKVKGHSGDTMNERCDQLAKAEAERQRHHAAFARQCNPEGKCDNCFKSISGDEAKRANDRSETLWFCDDCADQPQRVDFYLLPSGKRVVVTKMRHEGQRSIPLGEPTIVERDTDSLLAEYEANGYTVRRWDGGARAWLGKPWPIRTVSQVQRMRSSHPHRQIDFAYDG